MDIRVGLGDGIDLPVLASLHDRIRERYPERRERSTWQALVELGQGARVRESGGGPDGYLFSSADGRQIFQARLDGFTFSRLPPYQDWSALRDEARRLWDHYVAVAKPRSVSRLAVRYINRIELQGRVEDLCEWIRTAPSVSPALPQRWAGFFLRLVIPFPESFATAIVTETREEEQTSDRSALFFDIDVFREETLTPDDTELWDRLEGLRVVKNRVFFESLTPRCLELFR